MKINADDLAVCGACGGDMTETTHQDEDGAIWYIYACCGGQVMIPERMTWRFLSENSEHISGGHLDYLLRRLGCKL